MQKLLYNYWAVGAIENGDIVQLSAGSTRQRPLIEKHTTGQVIGVAEGSASDGEPVVVAGLAGEVDVLTAQDVQAGDAVADGFIALHDCASGLLCRCAIVPPSGGSEPPDLSVLTTPETVTKSGETYTLPQVGGITRLGVTYSGSQSSFALDYGTEFSPDGIYSCQSKRKLLPRGEWVKFRALESVLLTSTQQNVLVVRVA